MDTGPIRRSRGDEARHVFDGRDLPRLGPVGARARLQAIPEPVFGRCGAIDLAIRDVGLLRPALTEHLAGEHDFSDLYGWIEPELSQGPCQLVTAREAWSRPRGAVLPLESDWARRALWVGRRTPWVRDVVTLEIFEIATPRVWAYDGEGGPDPCCLI